MADNPTPLKTLKAFAIDEKLIDSFEAAIKKSSAAHSRALFGSIETALSSLITNADGMINPNMINTNVLDDFQRSAEQILKNSGLDKQVEDVFKIFNDRISSLNDMTQAAGFTSATVTDFERFEQINRSVNAFAQRVTNGAPVIADQVRNATLSFRNDLATGNRVRFETLVDVLTKKAGILPNYAKTIANTELMAIDRKGRFIQSAQSDLNSLRYTGVLDNLTRNFCREHIGVVKQRQEWQAMNNDMTSGAVNVADYCGGYNCRHRLILWRPEWNSDVDVNEPDQRS